MKYWGSFTSWYYRNRPIIQPVYATGITRVHDPDKGVWSTGSSFTVTLSYTPTIGDVMIATVGTRYGALSVRTVSSITETGVGWAFVVGGSQNSHQPVNSAEIWVGIVAIGSVSTSITINLSGPPTDAVANVAEYSGISPYVDLTASNNSGTDTTKTDSGTTGTTNRNGELFIASIAASYTGTPTDQSNPTNGFTLYDGVGHLAGGVSNGYLELIVSSPQTANTGTTITANHWAGAIATFFATVTFTTITETISTTQTVSTETVFTTTVTPTETASTTTVTPEPTTLDTVTVTPTETASTTTVTPEPTTLDTVTVTPTETASTTASSTVTVTPTETTSGTVNVNLYLAGWKTPTVSVQVCTSADCSGTQIDSRTVTLNPSTRTSTISFNLSTSQTYYVRISSDGMQTQTAIVTFGPSPQNVLVTVY
jgi:hypothetical protein